MSLQQPLFPAEDAQKRVAAEPAAVASAPALREAFLRERLLAKQQAAQGHHLVLQGGGVWQAAERGIQMLSLHSSADHRTLRINMAAGSHWVPPVDETAHECWVLQGEVRLGSTVLREGDFFAALKTEPTARWSSASGAQLLLTCWITPLE